MPSVPDDLLRSLIALAKGEPRDETAVVRLAEALALLPENQQDLTYALRQHGDQHPEGTRDAVPSALFIRDGVEWTGKLTRTD